MKKNIYICLFTFFLTSIFFQAAAQNIRYATTNIPINAPEIIELQINGSANVSADFNQPYLLDNGLELLNATTITYKSNINWFVTIKANSPFFNGGDSSTPMPASVIQYRLNGSGSPYTNLSTTEQTLMNVNTPNLPFGKGTVGIDFKLNPGYTYPPATNYNLQVIYTISNL